MIPTPSLVGNEPVGQWTVIAYPGGEPLDITFVRDLPTKWDELGTEDPFGPSTADLTFPGVSWLDSHGTGDLWWLKPYTDVDIRFATPDGEVLYAWEGYMEPFSWKPTLAGSQLSVALRGAMRQVDNYLAKPEYVYQPLPYETAIARVFANHPDLRLAPLTIEWPTWWQTVYREAATIQVIGQNSPTVPLYLRPSGLVDGQLWSGLVTRSTGSFDPSLTSYVQTLLANMYSESGQFTVVLDEGRQPVLRHRQRLSVPDADTLIIDALAPGLKIGALDEDWSQTANVFYGQGKALNGSSFSGMRSSVDGTRIVYEPMAWRSQVHPLESNDWYDPAVMRKEVMLSFTEGVSEAEGRTIARKHQQRFSDPGHIIEFDLSSDPRLGAGFLSRYLIRAGMSIQIPGLLGREDGLLFHITECTVKQDVTSIKGDTKYRDALTVSEVRARTRDALSPLRVLQVGQFKPTVNDQLFPWSYADGSGFLPKGAVSLFSGAPSGLSFPWTNWTTVRPPSDPTWRDSYVRIGPSSEDADKNWAVRDGSIANPAFPIRMSQAGESMLIQVAAYDRNGETMAVPFHLSLYRTNGVSVSAMPMMGLDDEAGNPPYLAGQHYPFFSRAWETIDENGVALNPETGKAVTTAQIIVGWGNSYEKAGYWPTSSVAAGATATGLLVDETSFSWDLTDAVYGVDPQRSAEENAGDPNRADVWCMIYCDAQLEREVFFLGRIWRKEPGTA